MSDSRKDTIEKIKVVSQYYDWPFPVFGNIDRPKIKVFEINKKKFLEDFERAMSKESKSKNPICKSLTNKPIINERAVGSVAEVVTKVVDSVLLATPRNDKNLSLELTLALRKELTEMRRTVFSDRNEPLQNAWIFYIVYYWGGIKSLRKVGWEAIRNQAFEILSTTFQNSPQRTEQNKIPFKRIASLSKVLAFFNEKDFFIYDSRVGLNLAFLERKLERNNKNGQTVEFTFPIPPGRSKRAEKFKGKKFKCKKSETYSKYCQYLNEVAANLFLSDKESQLVESCLFSIKEDEENAWTHVQLPPVKELSAECIAEAIRQTFFKTSTLSCEK